ncbi:MAG TPA: DUF2085 domain-containing protein [Coriobacteriia bacterium]|jgi:uncharacterized membrane protein
MVDALLHWLGYGLCHQLPERSFFAGVHQVPVCARDTGIYLGFVVSLFALWVLSRGKRPSDLPSAGIVAIAVAFIGAMVVDGVTSYAGWRGTTNEIRLATGLLAGYAMPVLMLPILNGQLWRHPGEGRVPADARQALWWLAPLPAVFVIVRWPFEWLGIFYPLIVAAAILGTFTIVNLAVVSVLPAAEGKAERLRDAWPWMAIAFALTVTEISASAWFRLTVTRLAAGGR